MSGYSGYIQCDCIDIKSAIEDYLAEWSRGEWMAKYGTWADDGDYINEGTIDPDSVRHVAEPLGVSQRWGAWNCKEGWAAYRHVDSLVINWWRAPYHARHERDLWVVVDKTFFAEVQS